MQITINKYNENHMSGECALVPSATINPDSANARPGFVLINHILASNLVSE